MLRHRTRTLRKRALCETAGAIYLPRYSVLQNTNDPFPWCILSCVAIYLLANSAADSFFILHFIEVCFPGFVAAGFPP
jgi:hypothetical protein